MTHFISYTISFQDLVKSWIQDICPNDHILIIYDPLNNYDYLSGHICIQTTNTNTYYLEPYHKERFILKNNPGNITLFPSWVEHFTDKVLDDKERITIAFDLRDSQSIKDIYPNMRKHWSKI